MSAINDMSLLELFLMELGTQCLVLGHELSMWDSSPGREPDTVLMHRAAHSITGAARIVDLEPVVALARGMENALAAGTPPQAKGELGQILEAAIRLFDQLAKTEASKVAAEIEKKLEEFSSLTARLGRLGAADRTELASSAERPRPAPDAAGTRPAIRPDDQLFHIFIDDAENNLAVLSDNLIQLERRPKSGPLLEASMRAVHSLKGAARIIGLTDIVTLAHAMEDLFIAAQAGVAVLGPGHVDALFSAADRIRDLIRQDESGLDNWFAANASTIAALSLTLRDLAAPPASGGQPTEAPAPPPSGPQAEGPSPGQSSSPDRRLRVSALGMSRIFALASEAMIESRWLPTLANSMNRLKRRQDEVGLLLDRLHAQLPGLSLPPLAVNLLAELAVKFRRSQQLLARQILEMAEHSARGLNISQRLHHEVIANRMQPISEGLIGLPRMVRDLSRKLGKKVRLEVIGSETLIDRDILDKLESPFTHLVTNAIDHGIEPPEQRESRGKPQEGTLRLTARHQAGMMLVTIADDGRGLDYPALRRKAVERRLASPAVAEELSEAELAEFLFLPNFTTRETADSTSGRGVGLDIVNSAVREVRGSIEIHSTPGQGTTFELYLPLTLSIVRALLFSINQEPYALPLVNIDHAARLPSNEIKEMGNRQYFVAGGKRLGLITAQQALELKTQAVDEDTLSVIVISGASHAYGLIVDGFLGIRDLVVQPLSPRLGKMKSVSAAAIAEDGTPILILDVNDLKQSVDHLISGDRLQRIEPRRTAKGREGGKRILVVDDSITVREVERKILSEHGFEVDTAVDGLDAWNIIRHQPPYDLIVTDIDMPNMDGIELLVHVKGTAEYEAIPVVILSYKDREEDRNRGLDAGADYYLTKSSFHSQALIEAVEDLIGGPGGKS
ncbi:MAG: response regulator [Desulfobacteraceae bacterium]|nr:response regulator [Desulfobacteraceae bacterium]